MATVGPIFLPASAVSRLVLELTKLRIHRVKLARREAEDQLTSFNAEFKELASIATSVLSYSYTRWPKSQLT
jgi:hypothetical protein